MALSMVWVFRNFQRWTEQHVLEFTERRTLKVQRNFRTFLTRDFRFSEISGEQFVLVSNFSEYWVKAAGNWQPRLLSVHGKKRVTTRHIHGTNWSKRTFSYGTRRVIPSGGITCHIWPSQIKCKTTFWYNQ